jgi:WD40 repeat protein
MQTTHTSLHPAPDPDLLGDADDCARAELLIAAGDRSRFEAGQDAFHDGFLAHHLARCAACREAALEPPAGSQPMLPEVSRDNYLLGVEIGRGGMGRVMAARDLRIGRAVAVKEMLASHPEARARFEREARITARLQHPGIVSVYEIGQWPDGHAFYAMPILPGRALRDAIASARDVTERLVHLPALIAAADAVAYAHSHGVVHRDLTPSNILLGRFGETVVIDWGLAKVLDEEESTPADDAGSSHGSPMLTRLGTVIGTPAYFAPEQAEGLPVDERADVYALGAILYELLVGRSPYHGLAAQTVIDQLRARPSPPRPSPRTGAPAALISLATRAMQPDPAQRFATAAEFVEELRRYQLGQRLQVHRYTRRELVGRWLSRRMSIVAAAGLILADVAGAAIIAGVRIARERRRVETTAIALLIEQGRQQALEGHPGPALAYLDEAHRRGDDSAALKALEASVRRSTDAGVLLGVLPERPLAQAFSPDGRFLAAARQYKAWIYDLASRQQIKVLDRTDLPLEFVRFTADGAHLLTWGAPGAPGGGVVVWSVGSWSVLRVLAAGRDLTKVDVSSDGRWLLAAGADDRGVEIWDIHSGAKVGGLAPRFAGDRIMGAFVGDGSRVVTFGGGERVALRDWRTGTIVVALPPESAFSMTAAASNDGSRLVTADASGAHLWQLPSGRRLANLTRTSAIMHASFNPAGTRILTLGEGHADLFAASDGALISPLGIVESNMDLETALFSPDGTRIAISRQGAIHAFDGRTGAGLEIYGEKDAQATYLAFSADGRWLASVYGDQSLRLWDMRQSALTGAIETPPWPDPSQPGGIRSGILGLDPDGNRLMLANGKDELEIHDRNGKRLPVSDAFRSARILALSADRTRALVLAPDPTARPQLRSTEDGHVLAAFSAAPIGMPGMTALSPDGAWLALSYPGRGTMLWNARTGTPATQFATLPAESSLAVFSPDGTRLLLRASEGGKTGLWAPASGQLVRDLGPQGAGSATFSPDGHRLLLVGEFISAVRAADGLLEYTLNLPMAGALEVQTSFSQDSAHLAILEYHLMIVAADSGRVEMKLADPGLSAALFLSDSDLMVTAGREGTSILDWRRGRALARLPGNDDPTSDRSFQFPHNDDPLGISRIVNLSANGKILALGHRRGGISLFAVGGEDRSADQLARLPRSLPLTFRLVDGTLVHGSEAVTTPEAFSGLSPDVHAVAENLGFEASPPGKAPAGWREYDDKGHYTLVTNELAHGGRQSVLLDHTDANAPKHIGLMQNLAVGAFQGKRLRLRAALRCTEHPLLALFIAPYEAAWPSRTVWRQQGECTGAWQEQELTMDLSPETRFFSIGVVMRGQGKAWVDDVRLDAVGGSTP